jgi:NAD(P)-dependent dehydrogenase (short-subunit alcohol dehydrogenase family)
MDTTARPEVTNAPRHKRTIAVTGSGSGIGAAVSRRFERSGLRVIGVDLRDTSVIADLSGSTGRAQAIAAVTELSGARLDGLVLCAGLGPQTQPTEMIVRVNFFGAIDVLDGMLPLLGAGEAPAAVVIASNSAGITPVHEELLGLLLEGDEDKACACSAGVHGATVYGMTKLALTRAMRRRVGAWGDAGVRLNAVAPGPVDTPLLAGGLEDPVFGPLIEALPVPMGRRGNPAEIAAAVGFLLDPANSYIHGSVLFVDGGSDALLRPDGL